MEILCTLIFLYYIALIARIVLSWFPVSPESPFAAIFNVLYAITEPVLGPIRRLIPPLGMGGMGFDLSPIIVFIGLQVIRSALCG